MGYLSILKKLKRIRWKYWLLIIKFSHFILQKIQWIYRRRAVSIWQKILFNQAYIRINTFLIKCKIISLHSIELKRKRHTTIFMKIFLNLLMSQQTLKLLIEFFLRIFLNNFIFLLNIVNKNIFGIIYQPISSSFKIRKIIMIT